jgi:hypothetical protein
MSTVAVKFSNASTKFQVGAAAIAVVAAATLTPAVVHATPSIAQAVVGNSISSVILEQVNSPVHRGANKVAPTTLAPSSLAGAVTTAGPIQNFITGLTQLVAGWFYSGITFVSDVVQGVANGIQRVADVIAQVFKVGPYATGSSSAAS